MQMSKTKYRWLVIVAFSLPFIGWVVDLLFPSLIPIVYRDAMDESYSDTTLTILLMQFVLLAVVIIFCIVYLYGLLRFRPWAPKFAIWSYFLTMAIVPFALIAPLVTSNVSFVVEQIGALLWGIVLVLPYLSPEIKAAFWPERT